MTQKANAKIPDISLASEPWVKEQLMDTENRIEKAFHDQTRYLQTRHEAAMTSMADFKTEMHRNNLQIVLAILAGCVAIVVAIFLK